MFEFVNLPIILIAALVASASPGPSTFAVAGTSMASGRKYGLAVAAGITTGSLIWSVAAALGLGALMLANAWVFEIIRYAGAGYLLYLAFKSAKSALSSGDAKTVAISAVTLKRAYAKGLALHITNPKTILFFGSLYAIGVPPGSSPAVLVFIIAAVGIQTFIVFHGYAFLFSIGFITRGYMRLRRWFEGLFALAFGAASIRILIARIQ